MRASRVSHRGYRLADLDRDRPQAGAAQICNHQQDACWRAAIYVANQGLENGRIHGCRHVRVQATRRRDQGRPGFRRHHGIRRTSPRHTLRSKEMISSRKAIMLAAAVAAFAAGLSWNVTSRVVESGFFSEAQARVGRPLTPMSYAGVARRTTRRAVAVGAAAGVAGAYYAPSCVQVVDAYGQV